MREKVNGFIRSIIRNGFIERTIFKYYLKVDDACEFTAFTSQMNEEDFENYYAKYLKFLSKNKIKDDVLDAIISCFLLNYKEKIDKEYDEKYQVIINYFESLDIKSYSVDRWRSWCQFFISNGMFQVGYICREKGIERLITRRPHIFDGWRRAIVYLEKREFEKALELIRTIRENIVYKTFLGKELISLETYYNSLSPIPEADFEPVFDKKRKEMSEILRGKDVVIIGPAPMEKGFPFKDREYIVIRNNERRKEDDFAYISERKTDITYYNSIGIRRIVENRDFDFFEQFKYVVAKNISVFDESEYKRARKADALNELAYAGVWNALPMILLDISQFKFARLYICGNNLFMSQTPHRKDYITSDLKLGNRTLVKSFSKHEMFSQFYLIKNMYLSDKFVADDELKNVLTLEAIEYARKMEEIYIR